MVICSPNWQDYHPVISPRTVLLPPARNGSNPSGMIQPGRHASTELMALYQLILVINLSIIAGQPWWTNIQLLQLVTQGIQINHVETSAWLSEVPKVRQHLRRPSAVLGRISRSTHGLQRNGQVSAGDAVEPAAFRRGNTSAVLPWVDAR